MVPRLYASGSVTFVNEGLGALSDCLSCEASTAINGVPELNVTYPINGRHADEIGERCIIVADQDHAKTAQPYIVRTIDKQTPGTMKIYAVHLACELLDGTGVSAFTATSLTTALSGLQSHATHANGITLASDFTSSTDFNHAQPSSMKQALGGMEGSILDTYGGEYDFSGLTVTLRTRLGADNGVIIRWAKNLQKLDMQIDWSTVYTGIYPFWVSLEGNSIKQMATPVYSLGTFPFDRVLMLNVSSEFETEPTDAQLLTFCVNYEATHTLTSPKISWKVTMKELRNTPEYKDVALLEQVALGDTVRIFLQLFGVNANARIVSERYDVLREQYNDLTIGSVRASLASTMVTQAKETQSAISNAETTLADAIKRATDAITGNVGGYIVTVLNASGEPQEQLILDNPDITQATKVWRWNLAGLGYSDTGYAGPYTTAITQDGEIVADFIKTGTLDASVVNVINLIAQHVRATDGTKIMNIDSAQLTANNGSNWRAWIRTDQNDQGVVFVYGGTRPNLNGDAADPGNDNTSFMSYLDPHGLSVGLDENGKPTGDVRCGSVFVSGGQYILMYDSSSVLRTNLHGADGTVNLNDSTGRTRVGLSGTNGNIRSYDSSGQERIGLYSAEGQLALYNSSGTRTVQIRGDGTASANPLPISQGGSGDNGTVEYTASITNSTGTTTAHVRRWGRVVQVRLICSNSSAISTPFGQIADATLSDIPLPIANQPYGVYMSSTCFAAVTLDTSGQVTARVITGSLSANSSAYFNLVYLSNQT